MEKEQANSDSHISERENRLAQRQELIEKGINPYPYVFDRSHYILAIRDNASAFAAEGQVVAICGKITAMRAHGGSIFFDLADFTARIQIYAKKDELGEEFFSFLENYVRLGDYVGIRGKVFFTKKGELSVLADGLELLAKAFRPLPSEFYGLQDTEKRFRQRYLDLILNDEVRDRFRKRAKIVDSIRGHLNQKDFLEIETPILHPIYGGANARPFKTYYESLKSDFYLRISDELYLKRAIIGNLEKVYEFSRDFRNEGLDPTHNPEFTMIEIYEAYKDYFDCMLMTKALILGANEVVGNDLKIVWGEKEIDLSGDWQTAKMSELLEKYAGFDVFNASREKLLEYARSIGLDMPDNTVWGVLVDKIFGEKVEPHLINPTFVIDYPLDISPLAKNHRDNPKLVERFELYIGGKEIANGFSELNDPVEQRARFEGQDRNAKDGDEEAHPLDEDFITAQEYGMPPTAGVGIGIDRLAMLLTNAVTIREVIMFPQLRND